LSRNVFKFQGRVKFNSTVDACEPASQSMISARAANAPRGMPEMNYPAAELRGIKMNFYLINPDAEHRGILLIEN
jgi:hypothetical protein